MKSVTCIAPVNIAVIKYWGKRNEKLILPLNDSLSGTLSMDHMCAKTTIAASSSFEENKFWLNGLEENFESERIQNCLEALKCIAKAKDPENDILKFNIHICSQNNFPTGAGLASSAAGFSCLVYCLASLYGIEDKELSGIARLGSGSACRSMYGGFVLWKKGFEVDGSDSIAQQIVDANYWPEMRVLILVVNDSRKKVSSSIGMRITASNSNLLRHRIAKCVPTHLRRIHKAIKKRDFHTFAEYTMKDSNQFHACCLDSYPPCVYMNDVSHRIAEVIHSYNKIQKKNKVAYTFDAGSNACLYMLADEVSKIYAVLNTIFPNDSSTNSEYIRGLPIDRVAVPEEALDGSIVLEPYDKNLFKYVIHTSLGDGPRKLDAEESLLNDEGLPIILN